MVQFFDNFNLMHTGRLASFCVTQRYCLDGINLTIKQGFTLPYNTERAFTNNFQNLEILHTSVAL